MWHSDDEIRFNLASKEPERIAEGLCQLEERMDFTDRPELPPLGIGLLEPFGPQVLKETQLTFLKIVARYDRFMPPLTEAQRLTTMVALVLAYADFSVAYEIALLIRVSPEPDRTARAAIREIAVQRLNGPQRILGAQRLIGGLLDGGGNVRRATLDAIKSWPSDAARGQVIEYIKLQLDAGELDL